MEVDVLSPQLRMRSISNKRSRSPGSPGLVERASKRAMVIQCESVSQASCRVGVQQELTVAGKPRSVHEDEWVHQTRGMTIHSPSLGEGVLSLASSADEALTENSRTDVQMSGADDASRTETETRRQEAYQQQKLPTPDSDHPLGANTDAEDFSMRSPMASQSLDAVVPPSHSPLLCLPGQDGEHGSIAIFSDSTALENPPPHSAPPTITLHPATPSTPTDGPRNPYSLTFSRSSSPPLTSAFDESPSSPMSITGDSFSLSSSSTLTSQWKSNIQRKYPVLSMGPRADCEKCRMKEPGHYMHI
ncbi:uncharacterized protein FOMMEDRAFT_145292 [Fomitiporia mediterranea MF3/22]|uniref:uncharacterized protein n=1 Tax=Fomitiporia mediterranea (strain MF3/22) TaxID=694068 RepID=UPI00044081F5|nr:uncharacterized protein FOMMEDRAFT_145292 [Fomitiporia mediterranea MF3/22]EJD05946.1 hypothetical protein FOMMEDRAFT_145292 [Fomitiporia mediterranea MF3/22]